VDVGPRENTRSLPLAKTTARTSGARTAPARPRPPAPGPLQVVGVELERVPLAQRRVVLHVERERGDLAVDPESPVLVTIGWVSKRIGDSAAVSC